MSLQAAHRPSEHVSPAQVSAWQKGSIQPFPKSVNPFHSPRLSCFTNACLSRPQGNYKHWETESIRPPLPLALGRPGSARPAVSAPLRGRHRYHGGLALRAPRDSSRRRAQAPPTREAAVCPQRTHRRTLTHRHTHGTDDCFDDLSAITEVKCITQKPSASLDCCLVYTCQEGMGKKKHMCRK